MRKLLWAAALAAPALLLPPAIGRAGAQCTVGCVSSSSCEGTGKGSCIATCDQWGTCACADKACGTQIRPVTFAAAQSRRLVTTAEDQPHGAALVVDCHGNVLDVRLSGGDKAAVFGGLRAIRLEHPREAGAHLAVRD
jgi:hypothetical protein